MGTFDQVPENVTFKTISWTWWPRWVSPIAKAQHRMQRICKSMYNLNSVVSKFDMLSRLRGRKRCGHSREQGRPSLCRSSSVFLTLMPTHLHIAHKMSPCFGIWSISCCNKTIRKDVFLWEEKENLCFLCFPMRNNSACNNYNEFFENQWMR